MVSPHIQSHLCDAHTKFETNVIQLAFLMNLHTVNVLENDALIFKISLYLVFMCE